MIRPLIACVLAGAVLLLGPAGVRAEGQNTPGTQATQTLRAAEDTQSFATIERGRYLATAADCTACHTPIGGALFSGGRPLETPFGTLLGPNITPDPTGIGDWTEADFQSALRRGIGHDGVHLYPAMPYTYYTGLTPEDVHAIWVYLQTVPAVHNPVRANQLPFPFDVRASLIGWDELFFKPGTFKPDPSKSAEWNRGAYLAEAAEHCSLCHTPKNFVGADNKGRVFQGYALQGWFAPNLTGDKRQGLGDWTVDDLALYLKTGRNRFELASGPMAEAVADLLSHLTDADIHAIAVYIKDQASVGEQVQPQAANTAAMQRGKAIYTDECAACHTMQGAGIAGLFPKLAGAPVVQQKDPASLIHVVLAGSRAVATSAAPTGPAMPSFAWKLSDDEVAAVVTYIRNSWGNAGTPVSAATVATQRQRLHNAATQ